MVRSEDEGVAVADADVADAAGDGGRNEAGAADSGGNGEETATVHGDLSVEAWKGLVGCRWLMIG
jgi:hypothetical protein